MQVNEHLIIPKGFQFAGLDFDVFVMEEGVDFVDEVYFYFVGLAFLLKICFKKFCFFDSDHIS